MLDSANDNLRRRLQWFLLLRLGVTTCLLTATIFLYYGERSTSSQVGGLVLGAIGCTYFVSLISGLLLNRVHNLSLFSYLQVIFDTLFITGIVLLTGGLSSPFSLLYHLAILNVALFLFRRGALVAASFAAICYGGTVDLLYYGVFPASGFSPATTPFLSVTSEGYVTVRLLVNLVSFYAIAFLGSYLTHQLSRAETLLAEREVAFDRLSSLYQGVIQNLESGLLITDVNNCVEYANGPIGHMLGIDPPLLAGRTVKDLIPALSPNYPVGTPLEFEFRKPGHEQTLIFRAIQSPLHDTYGNRIGMLLNVQDVTNIKDLEQEIQATEELERLIAQNDPAACETFAGLVGRSEGINKVYQLIAKVAESATTVLITGESGTGKELVARAIHEKGPRVNGAFVPVNCGAIPESLIESELFGHIKGAFTGAVNNRLGLFREADGGTIFLDEIGELPSALQVKLLRALQEREVTPVGASKEIPVDVRVLAATNKNLEEEVAGGRFREDLFYRLNVIRISLPPLRERRGDLLLLIDHFLKCFSTGSGKSVHQVSPHALRILLSYAYPGNIRELENMIQHAVTMAEGEIIQLSDLPAHLCQTSVSQVSLAASEHIPLSSEPLPFFEKGVSLDAELEEYERSILRAALEKAGGIQKRAAEVLGINYRSLRHRLQKYHLA